MVKELMRTGIKNAERSVDESIGVTILCPIYSPVRQHLQQLQQHSTLSSTQGQFANRG